MKQLRSAHALCAVIAAAWIGYAIAGVAAAAPAHVITEETAQPFSQSDEASPYRIDHSQWSRFLGQAVFDVGPSTRKPAPRGKGGVYTSTRITTGSKSRYRFESNRVLFHLFNDDTTAFIRSYRAGLLNAVDKVGYSSLSSDEQLVFWFNLYNVVLVDEIAKRYPVSSPHRIRVRESGNASLFQAKLVTVNGVALSLDDIQYGIVYRYWKDPDVIYGFWGGAIGGPSLPTNAYTSDNVRETLGYVGRRYVNSLRGVELRAGRFSVSQIYDDARVLFPNWPQDLFLHLDSHANADVAELLSPRPSSVQLIKYDLATADFANGETATFGGSDNAAAALTLKPEPGEDTAVNLLQEFGAPIRNKSMRGDFSADTEALSRRAEEQRARREGKVSIEDVETEDAESDDAAAQTDQSSQRSEDQDGGQ